MGQQTEVKLPKAIPFNIGDKVSLDLKAKDYNGISLRSDLIRDIIRGKYATYKNNKLSTNIKKVVRDLISVLDVCDYGVVLGVEACGTLCMDYLTCNMCYVTGGYSGLDFYKYKILIHGTIIMESGKDGDDTRLNHVQYTIPNMCWGISKINLVVSK